MHSGATTRGQPKAPAVPRVLFVSSHSQLGGSEQVLADLLRCLPPAADAGTVCLQDGPFVPSLRSAGTTVDVLSAGATPADLLAAAWRLRRLVRRAAPDVVHANGVKAAAVAALAATGVPVVWMKHDIYRDGGLSRLLARRCAAVPCVSEVVAQDVRRSGRVSIVHPGVRVDVEQARREAVALRRQLDISGPVVSVIGRLDPAKGHAELLEVLPELRRAVPGVTALLVGGDDPHHPGQRAALTGRAADLDLLPHVVLPGHLPAAAVLAASDAVCIPTVPEPNGRGQEGFGLVAAEALALGVPVIAYDAGATAEVLAGCGLLVAVGDRHALAARIRDVLTDEVLRTRLRNCAEHRAAQLRSERTAEQMLEVYRRAVT